MGRWPDLVNNDVGLNKSGRKANMSENEISVGHVMNMHHVPSGTMTIRYTEYALKCAHCGKTKRIEPCSKHPYGEGMDFIVKKITGQDDVVVFCKICEQKLPLRWKCDSCGADNTLNNTIAKKKDEGCFIATAVYGSCESHNVIILRQYRDEVLLNSKLGRAFISLYYAVSPPIADFIVSREYLKTIVRFIVVIPAVNWAKRML
jgi:hypothetical protein